MKLLTVDPRALKENTDRARQTPSTPQADGLLLATIKAIGIVQPPVVSPEADGGNGYVIDAGHRRVRQAIEAGLEEITVLVADAGPDNGAMRSMVENIAREPLNPVDQWRAVERLVALGWTEEAIGVALALPVRHIRKLRLLAGVLPAMLDNMAKGDMPQERELRIIAAAPLSEQKEVWKKHKPSKTDTRVAWYAVASALQKVRMFAKDASFDDALATAYGITWSEDLFAPADEDSRYTTDVDAFLGAQQEWMANHLPKRGSIVEADTWGSPKLPAKAERVYGKPGKSDRVAMYLDKAGKVQTAHYRVPETEKAAAAATVAPATPRPDVTQLGTAMIGDFRTDALHEALARAPIDNDTLLALLVLALSGRNVSIASGSSGTAYGYARMDRHAVGLVDADGRLRLDPEALQQAARGALIDTLSCRVNRTNSGDVALIAGAAIGADAYLPNMGTQDFLSCLSRAALEAAREGTPVEPRKTLKDTRTALAEHFKTERFVHPAAPFAPEASNLVAWLGGTRTTEDDVDDLDDPADGAPLEEAGAEESDDAYLDGADDEDGFLQAAE